MNYHNMPPYNIGNEFNEIISILKNNLSNKTYPKISVITNFDDMHSNYKEMYFQFSNRHDHFTDTYRIWLCYWEIEEYLSSYSPLEIEVALFNTSVYIIKQSQDNNLNTFNNFTEYNNYILPEIFNEFLNSIEDFIKVPLSEYNINRLNV